MNVWGYLATRTPSAIDRAVWALIIGLPAAGACRVWEILRDEDQPTDIKEQP